MNSFDTNLEKNSANFVRGKKSMMRKKKSTATFSGIVTNVTGKIAIG